MKLEDYFEEADPRPGVREAEEKLRTRLAFAHAVIVARTRMNITQAELAERVGTKQNSISRIESASANPTLSMVNKLCNVLGITVNFQYGEPAAQGQTPAPIVIMPLADTQYLVAPGWAQGPCLVNWVSSNSATSADKRFDE